MIVTSSMSVEYVRKMEVILMMIVTSSMSVEYVRKMKVILVLEQLANTNDQRT
jgi:hypothetical protein